MNMMTFYSMKTMTVQWQKCRYHLFWCRLDSELLDDPRLEFRLQTHFGIHRFDVIGVYIIWAGIDNRTILKVGSGFIKQRLGEHLRDPKVQAYRSKGLYATWARITPSLKIDGTLDDRAEGVERFLGWWLKPVLAERFPKKVDPIMVNLPMWYNPYQVERSFAQMLAKNNNLNRSVSPFAQMLAKKYNPNRVESSLDRILGKR